MNIRSVIVAATGSFALATAVAFANAQVQVDPHHTSASFSIAHLTITKVSGTIPLQRASLLLDTHDVPQSATAIFDASKIQTQDEHRDEDLRSDKWFNTTKYPTIVFRSTSIVPAADKSFTMHGTLTMHGLTKPVTLHGEYAGKAMGPEGKVHYGYTASGVIDRTAWNVGQAPAAIVGSEVSLSINLEALSDK